MINYLLHLCRILETFLKYGKNIKGWGVVIKKSRIECNDNVFHSRSLIINSTLNNAITIHEKASIINSEVLGYNKIGKNTGVSNSIIGNYTYIGDYSRINNVKIGNYVSIANYFKIGLGIHPTNYISTCQLFYNSSNHLKITLTDKTLFNGSESGTSEIGNDVWIGENVIVMSGIKIGDGAIIGAGAVVTKDVPNYAIVGGVPAKIIRYRFSEKVIKSLLKLKWWDKEIEWLKLNQRYFQKSISEEDDISDLINTNN